MCMASWWKRIYWGGEPSLTAYYCIMCMYNSIIKKVQGYCHFAFVFTYTYHFSSRNIARFLTVTSSTKQAFLWCYLAQICAWMQLLQLNLSSTAITWNLQVLIFSLSLHTALWGYSNWCSLSTPKILWCHGGKGCILRGRGFAHYKYVYSTGIEKVVNYDAYTATCTC